VLSKDSPLEIRDFQNLGGMVGAASSEILEITLHSDKFRVAWDRGDEVVLCSHSWIDKCEIPILGHKHALRESVGKNDLISDLVATAFNEILIAQSPEQEGKLSDFEWDDTFVFQCSDELA
jgi:superfamily I DNA/RNA helicase